jgi:uncharacterized protein (DUF58 family)
MDGVWKKFFDPLVLERLRGTSLRSRRPATGALVGMHRSPRSGQAIEFSEHRQYTPGDDLRQLDWKVLGRTDKFYLRQREDETTMQVHVMVDHSGSMAYQGDGVPFDKLRFAFRVAASLAFVASENHDAVSVTCLGQSVLPLIGPGSGSEHLMGIATAMDRVQPQADAAIAERLMATAGAMSPGGLVILISDLFEDDAGLLNSFRAIRSTGRSMIVVQVMDPSELEFPYGDTVQYVGLEGESALTVDARGVGAAYRKELAEHNRRLERGCQAAGITFWSLMTDVPLHLKLPELIDAYWRK